MENCLTGARKETKKDTEYYSTSNIVNGETAEDQNGTGESTKYDDVEGTKSVYQKVGNHSSDDASPIQNRDLGRQ